ncbi:DUF1573 domain-containing protein [Roseivirga sp. BDSF3-8]|uniref:DUF1573 domain-containing protein n=1 Tax=Roseivirga sp. BDSF3-8 TaxID=3241598 RepID=UPI003531D3D3
MKKGFVLLTGLLFAVFITAGAATFEDMLRESAIKFAKRTHDFGAVDKGEPVTAAFSFRNEGDTPLIITEVKTSCGCTVSEYPKEAIAPGEAGVIKATYNAAKTGAFTKTVKVFTNDRSEPMLLTLKGEVR